MKTSQHAALANCPSFCHRLIAAASSSSLKLQPTNCNAIRLCTNLDVDTVGFQVVLSVPLLAVSTAKAADQLR
jgi:hypothetical protein